MLYDKRWDKQTKADPFTLESLIAWLEKQPADQEYDWPDAKACLACVYLQAHGYSKPWAAMGMLFPAEGYSKIFGSLDRYHEIGSPMPWTFGAALTRARTALPLSQRGEK